MRKITAQPFEKVHINNGRTPIYLHPGWDVSAEREITSCLRTNELIGILPSTEIGTLRCRQDSDESDR